jgi:pilus assembly protein Flp/PilA
MIIKAITTLQSFRKEEDGLALTEYLVVLGLLVGGTIIAVTLFGDNLAEVWTNWAGWVVGLDANL